MTIKKNIAISDSGFMFDPTSGDSYSLNAVGIDIIQHLKLNLDDEDIIRELHKKYDADKTIIEKNYFDFMDMLKQYNLIEND